MPLAVLFLILFALPLAAQTGSIRISRQVHPSWWNESETNRQLAGVYTGCRVDGGTLQYPTAGTRTNTVSGLTVGDHLVECEAKPSFIFPKGEVLVGTCSEAEGSDTCEVSSFTTTPTLTPTTTATGMGWWAVTVAVTSGQVTEVGWGFRPTPYGHGAATTGATNGAPLPVTNTACSGAGSLTEARNTLRASGNQFAYFDLAMGADATVNCPAANWPNQILKISNENLTIWGHSSNGAVRIAENAIEVNQLDDTATCRGSTNVYLGGFLIDGQNTSGRGGLSFINGSSTNNCGGVKQHTYFVNSVSTYNTSARDCLSVDRNHIYNGTITGGVIANCIGEGFLFQRDSYRWTIHNNLIHRITNRAPWIKWCTLTATCGDSPPNDDTNQVVSAWVVENIQTAFYSAAGNSQSIYSGSTRAVEERNASYAMPDTPGNDDSTLQRLSRVLSSPSLFQGTPDPTDLTEALIRDNLRFSAYNAVPTRVRQADLSTLASWTLPTLPIERTAAEAGEFTLRHVGPRPFNATLAAWVNEVEAERLKATPITRINSSGDDFTGWADPADMTVVDDGAPQGNVFQLGTGTPIAFQGEDDGKEFLEFRLKTSANPSTTGTVARFKNSGGTVIGRIELTAAGEYRFDNDATAGSEVSILASAAVDTWRHFRLVKQSAIAGTCTPSVLDPNCHKVEAGVSEGGLSGSAVHLKDGFYTASGDNVASVEFVPLAGTTVWIDDVGASPTSWCSEGGCAPTAAPPAQPPGYFSTSGFFSVSGTFFTVGESQQTQTPCASYSPGEWTSAMLPSEPFDATAAETQYGDACYPLLPPLPSRVTIP